MAIVRYVMGLLCAFLLLDVAYDIPRQGAWRRIAHSGMVVVALNVYATTKLKWQDR